MSLDAEKITFKRHCDEISTTSFCCGEAEIDKWFRAKSLRDHGRRKHVVTCAHIASDPVHPVGFYALSSVVEEARHLPGTFYIPFFGDGRYFPCLSMVYLAVTRERQRQRIGSAMMARVILDFADYGERIGLPLLIVTPLNAKIALFYERLGFEHYKRGVGKFLPLQTAIETRDQLISL